MLRLAAVVAAVMLAVPDARACTFCGGSLQSRPTLRIKFGQAGVVLFGEVRNPRFDPKTDEGFTDFHAKAVLKDDPARGGQALLVLPRYIPVVGNTPTEYLLFCDVTNGKLDATYGVPAPAAVVDYLKAAAKLDDADPAAKLGFFFSHLDAADPTVAADAFVEFARASDAEIIKARAKFDPAKVRKLLADPNTPVERLGVFAFVLGACGGKDDAASFAAMLGQSPLPERSTAALGGLLAGYIQLDPKAGWDYAAAALGDPKRAFADRLAVLGTVRFFQATRGAEFKPQILACCAAQLPHGDIADQAVEDLRRWGWWDLTPEVLAQFGKPTHAAPIVRRGIVRYALTCPRDDAKAFVAAVRTADPKLVAAVEDMLSLYDPVKPSPK